LKAIIKIGIYKEEKEKRTIVFHSQHHRYSANIRNLVDARSLGLDTGHKIMAMIEHYSVHANENHFKAAREATEKAFGQGKIKQNTYRVRTTAYGIAKRPRYIVCRLTQLQGVAYVPGFVTVKKRNKNV